MFDPHDRNAFRNAMKERRAMETLARLFPEAVEDLTENPAPVMQPHRRGLDNVEICGRLDGRDADLASLMLGRLSRWHVRRVAGKAPAVKRAGFAQAKWAMVERRRVVGRERRAYDHLVSAQPLTAR